VHKGLAFEFGRHTIAKKAAAKKTTAKKTTGRRPRSA
jgi:hypothetical protein